MRTGRHHAWGLVIFFLFWKSIVHWSMVITISLQLSADAGVTPILEQLIRLSRC